MQAVCVLGVAVLFVVKPVFGQKEDNRWIWIPSSKENIATAPANVTDVNYLHNEDLAYIPGHAELKHQDPSYQRILDSSHNSAPTHGALHPITEVPWPMKYHLPPGQAQTPKVNSPAHQTRNPKLFNVNPTPDLTGAFSAVTGSAVHAPPLRRGDGTTKSRVVIDNLYSDGQLNIEKDEKYTTLDKLFQERGQARPSGNIFTEDLGGLDPREIFYADDDLVIIKGGYFNSDSFAEPQVSLEQSPLSPGDHEDGVSTKLVHEMQSPEIKLPPNSNDEYNGNIPAIIPPPLKDSNLSHSLPANTATFVVSPSESSQIYKPSLSSQIYKPSFMYMIYMPLIHVQPQSKNLPTYTTPQQQLLSLITYTSTNNIPDRFLPSCNCRTFQKHVSAPIRQMSAPIRQMSAPIRHASASIRQTPTQLPVSLAGDTRVNYLAPRPPINSDAELIDVHVHQAPGSASVPNVLPPHP